MPGPRADSTSKPKVKVKPKGSRSGKSSVGSAISNTAKGKPVSFGAGPSKADRARQKAVAGKTIRGELKPVVKKKNPRTASDPNPTPKLKRAGALPDNVGVRLSPAGKAGVAGALKILDVTARPLYAAANMKKQELINQGIGPGQKGSVLAAGGRGITGKDKTLYSDVYKQAGLHNKTAAAVLGTATDIAVSGAYPGARGGSLARSGAEIAADKAVRRVTRKVAKKVRDPEIPKPPKPRASDVKARAEFTPEARKARFQNMAADRAEREAKKQRGVWVGVGWGKHGQVRLKRRSDRTLMGKPKEPGKVATKVANTARGLVHEVRPMVRANALSSLDDHVRVQDIRREQRGRAQKGLRDAQDRYDALQLAIPVEHRPAVAAAMEAGSVKGLPDDLKDTGRKLIAAAKHRQRLRRQAGMGGDVERVGKKVVAVNPAKPTVAEKRAAKGRPKAFYPHIQERQLLDGKVDDPFKDVAGHSAERSRTIHKTVAAHNAAKPAERFSEDVPAVWSTYEMSTARSLADRHGAIGAREVGRELPVRASRKTGKPIMRLTVAKGGKKTYRTEYDVSGVGPHETVVHVGERVTPLGADAVKALERGDRGAFKGGQFRVMSTDHAVQLAKTPAQPSGKWARNVVRPWKAVATATPQFQLRNLVGDEARVFDAGVPAHSVPALNKEAVRSIRFSREHGASFGEIPDGGTVNLGKSGTATQKQFMDELQRNGIVSSGIRTGELTHIGGDAQKLYGRTANVAESSMPRVSAATQAFRDIWREAGREAGRPLHNLAKLFQDRENMTYTSLYLHFRRAGEGERSAAQKTMDALIDYGNITDTERMLRNSLFPFYTFQSRVVPFYAKTLLQRPGKIAAYEAVRQELGKYFGMPADDLMKEAMYRQRLAGFPIAGKWVSDGLPFAQGLNELPTNLNMAEYAREVFRYATGSAGPWVKALPELAPVVYGAPGFNFFFEAPLESPNHRFVAAPVVPGVPWEKMPESTRKRLGVKQIEMRDGSLVWAWRGWKSYVLNIATPGAPGFALRAGQEVNRRGQNKQQQWLGFLTGVKIDNPDPIGAALGNAYSRRDLLTGARGDLSQEPGGKQTPQYKKLNAQIRDLNRLIYALSKKRGDKNPLGTAPPKPRVRKSSSDDLGLDLDSGSDSNLGLDLGD